MNINYCVCDMDGTLLNSARDISEGTERALRRLQEQGVTLVLATGRTDLYVKDAVQRLGVTAPVISSNGALIRNMATGEVLYHKYLPEHLATAMAERCFSHDYDALIYSPEYVFHRSGSQRIQVLQGYNARVTPDLRVPLKAINGPEDLPLSRLVKFFLWNIGAEQEAALKEIYGATGELSLVTSEHLAFDVMAAGISKGAALQFLANHYDFDLAKTAVFGDNYNDISMLQIAGYSVAMGNAESPVKAAAKYVTRSNDEDGIAYAIEHILPVNC